MLYSASFEPLLIFVIDSFFYETQSKKGWNPPSYVEISHDTQQKPLSTLYSASFEPMLIFVIDTFLWNPIKESLKPTFICWNISWHPAETFIYITFCIFWANVNFCPWYFFLWNTIKESLKPTFICWNITWHPSETFIYLIFCIFWANVNFCHWYFCLKPNQRKPETHLHMLKYHMTPSRNLHLHYILHLLSQC